MCDGTQIVDRFMMTVGLVALYSRCKHHHHSGQLQKEKTWGPTRYMGV